ncbi:hypothetical protein HANVADRAFT_111871 [Hanseniaspora valbyensis NRRL Y-1626]|uniref:Transmembrane protein n=1 Tax=Hanseniaspora valbyensis NRRL Y-1626 TaxID=766949 RepID=A0A1B7SFW0_9ASCO|nr:hypothetical protein HANVADRAFT_111871 [Hanseniaspora valbyensis NRRL Y-1626]
MSITNKGKKKQTNKHIYIYILYNSQQRRIFYKRIMLIYIYISYLVTIKFFKSLFFHLFL